MSHSDASSATPEEDPLFPAQGEEPALLIDYGCATPFDEAVAGLEAFLRGVAAGGVGGGAKKTALTWDLDGDGTTRRVAAEIAEAGHDIEALFGVSSGLVLSCCTSHGAEHAATLLSIAQAACSEAGVALPCFVATDPEHGLYDGALRTIPGYPDPLAHVRPPCLPPNTLCIPADGSPGVAVRFAAQSLELATPQTARVPSTLEGLLDMLTMAAGRQTLLPAPVPDVAAGVRASAALRFTALPIAPAAWDDYVLGVVNRWDAESGAAHLPPSAAVGTSVCPVAALAATVEWASLSADGVVDNEARSMFADVAGLDSTAAPTAVHLAVEWRHPLECASVATDALGDVLRQATAALCGDDGEPLEGVPVSAATQLERLALHAETCGRAPVAWTAVDVWGDIERAHTDLPGVADPRRWALPGSLLSRFAFEATFLPELGEAALLWGRLVDRLRSLVDTHDPARWREARDVLQVATPQEAPDLEADLLQQKLQALDLCLQALLRGAAPPPPAAGWDTDTTSPDLERSFGSAQSVPGSDGTSPSPPASPAAEAPPPPQSAPVTALLDGRPLVQPAVGLPLDAPVTRDVLERQAADMEALGPGTAASRTRAWLQADGLQRDMARFKASNPTAVFADFVAWHSPKDFRPAACAVAPAEAAEGVAGAGRWAALALDHVSPRMRCAGNAWHSAWEGAVPAASEPADGAALRYCPELEARVLLRWLAAVDGPRLAASLLRASVANAAHRLLTVPLLEYLPATHRRCVGIAGAMFRAVPPDPVLLGEGHVAPSAVRAVLTPLGELEALVSAAACVGSALGGPGAWDAVDSLLSAAWEDRQRQAAPSVPVPVDVWRDALCSRYFEHTVPAEPGTRGAWLPAPSSLDARVGRLAQRAAALLQDKTLTASCFAKRPLSSAVATPQWARVVVAPRQERVTLSLSLSEPVV